MRKIGTYLRSFWQSIKDKPFIFVLYIISIMLSVLVSTIAYRMTKTEVKNFENKGYYAIDFDENFESAQFYKDIQGSNILYVSQNTEIGKDFINKEGEEENISIRYSKEYFPSEYAFTREQIESAERIAVISKRYAELENLAINDEINVFGTNFIVIDIQEKNMNCISIPATVPNVFFAMRENQSPNYVKTLTFGTFGYLDKSVKKLIAAGGFYLEMETPPINFGMLLGIVVGLVLISIASLNVFVANKIIADKNSKRYSLYRVVGAKNRDVATVMVAESLVVVVLAFFLGAIAEFFAIRPIMTWGDFARLAIVDYLALFFINAFAVIITTAIVIFKKLYHAPMDSRQRGKL